MQTLEIPISSVVENEAVVSDIPTMLFSDEYDPITPPKWAGLAAETLSTHFYYKFPNVSHGVMRSNPCALQMGLAFLDNPLHTPDSSCINELEDLKFR